MATPARGARLGRLVVVPAWTVLSARGLAAQQDRVRPLGAPSLGRSRRHRLKPGAPGEACGSLRGVPSVRVSPAVRVVC